MAIFKYIESAWLSNLVEIIFFDTLLLGVHSLKSECSWIWAVYIMTLFLAEQVMIKIHHSLGD